MSSGALSPVLLSLREDLARLGGGWEADGLRARDFMDGLVELGLLAQRDPGLRDAPELRAFLEESAAALEAHLGALDKWLLDLEAAAAEAFVAGDEWAGLARERSALAFLRELFAGAEWIERFDTDDLDATLRVRCEEDALLDPATVPAGMPREHWWWWCAQAP